MRKILCIILTCLICSITPIVLAVDATQLQDKQKEVQEQINKTNDELSDLKMDITENLEQVQKLDEKNSNSRSRTSRNNRKSRNITNNNKTIRRTTKNRARKNMTT